MNTNYILKEYYIRYLKDVRQNSDSSVKHYTGALNKISDYLVQFNLVDKMIYEVDDIQKLNHIKAFLYSDNTFKEMDARGNRMYSSGLNNYVKFIGGEGLYQERKKCEVLDMAMPVQGTVVEERTMWKRSSVIKVQSIEMAGYLCEIDSIHTTFISKSSDKQYMEGHHAIPMNVQEKFSNSLDVYANIICLCPICHRLLHYGMKEDKLKLINQIYGERHNRLANSGLRIGKQEFIDIVI